MARPSRSPGEFTPSILTVTFGIAVTTIVSSSVSKPFFVNLTTAPSAAVGFDADPVISPVVLSYLSPVGNPLTV